MVEVTLLAQLRVKLEEDYCPSSVCIEQKLAKKGTNEIIGFRNRRHFAS